MIYCLGDPWPNIVLRLLIPNQDEYEDESNPSGDKPMFDEESRDSSGGSPGDNPIADLLTAPLTATQDQGKEDESSSSSSGNNGGNPITDMIPGPIKGDILLC